MRTSLAILLLLPLALGVPTGPEASASPTPAGCGCQQESIPSCAGACCADDVTASHDGAGICDCGTTDDAPNTPVVPTTTGSEKPIRDTALERAPQVADTTTDAHTGARAPEGHAPPAFRDDAPSDFCVWRN